MTKILVLELFSGIGGMHFALQESGLSAEVIAGVDINTIANQVYSFNFKHVPLIQGNIQSLTAEYIDKLSPDMIVMSPPCQPFTRVGLKKDITDKRSDALVHIISLIPKLGNKLRYILLENVKGFETSESRNQLIKILEATNFVHQEFLLSPIQFEIPNNRERYYLLAKRRPLMFSFPLQSSVMNLVPEIPHCCDALDSPKCVGDFLGLAEPDSEIYDSYLLPDTELKKRASVLDIVTYESYKSCCFTKAYTRYAEGTGSVFCPFSLAYVSEVFTNAQKYDQEDPQFVYTLRALKLRYFTPEEVAKLMCFPERFQFPENITTKQKYRLLGNSLNVAVVSKLLRLLSENDEYS